MLLMVIDVVYDGLTSDLSCSKDRDVKAFIDADKPPNLHLLSTVGMPRGLEHVGVIASAGAIIHRMTHPGKPDRLPADTRMFPDLPDGINEPAAIGGTWQP